MVPKLRLNRTRSLTLLKREGSFLKLLNHLAPCKSSQISAILSGWAEGNVFGYGAELFAFVEPGFDVFCFCLCFDQYVCTVNFIWHKQN